MLDPDHAAKFIEVLYSSYTVRIHKHTQTGNVWFVLADVCKVLKITNPSYVAQKISKANKHKHKILTKQGKIKVMWVSYAGLTQLFEALPNTPELADFWIWSHTIANAY